MARQRSHSVAFKRQVAQEFLAGESLYALSKRHDISRQLAGECTVHAAAARDYAKELPCTDGARGAKEKESDASAKPSGAAMYPAFDPKVICCRERATSTTSQAVSHFLFS